MLRRSRRFSFKFYREGFDRFWDADPNKMACSNCVIEWCEGKTIPRSGEPEDFITMNTYCPYLDEYSMTHPLIIHLNKWLAQVFTDKDLLHYTSSRIRLRY